MVGARHHRTAMPLRLPLRLPLVYLLALHRVSASRRREREAAAVSESSMRLVALIEDKLQLAAERMARGPPAFERFPDKALRFRDWGKETRWGRGDAYPLYTLDTMRNLADHLFDWTSGYRSGASRAAQVKPCDLVYSTLRPTAAFVQKVHQHIRVPYLLLTDTADDPITPGKWTNQMLGSEQLWRWWAVDNEMSHPKLESIPIGLADNLEPPGKPKQPASLVFHANLTTYLLTLRRALQQVRSPSHHPLAPHHLSAHTALPAAAAQAGVAHDADERHAPGAATRAKCLQGVARRGRGEQ